jgi:tetratricopeptide (TPR) repeat protein
MRLIAQLPSSRLPKSFCTNPSGSLAKGSTDTDRCRFLYEKALRFARHQNHKAARRAFQTCIAVIPDFSKAWVSWAQMEKRTVAEGQGDGIERCRRILQQGLALNPTDAKILQAWGLLELQRGNVLAAVLLLERCVQYEPTCCPVLQWRAVQVAKQSVGDRIQKHLTLPLSQLADRESEQDHQEPPLALP